MDSRSHTLTQDARIAAVAVVNRLAVLTRDLRGFDRFTVSPLDPSATLARN